MMATPLTLTDRLKRFQDYTFRFSFTGGIFVPGEDTIRSQLALAYSFVDNVRVSRGAFSGQFAVQFRWTGLDGAGVSTVADAMTQVFYANDWTVAFVDAFAGRASESFDIGGTVGAAADAIKETAATATKTVNEAVKAIGDLASGIGGAAKKASEGTPKLSTILIGAGVVLIIGIGVYAVATGFTSSVAPAVATRIAGRGRR